METPREPPVPPRRARWALLAISLAAFAIRLPGLTAEEPWFDEIFSILVASDGPVEAWRHAVADQTSPPGFYLLLWGWIQLGGPHLAWLRLLSLLASVLTVPAIAVAARAAGLRERGALTAAALAAVSPLMLAMSSEVRTYALLALASTLTLAAAARQRTWLTAAGGVALVMLHYFGVLAVAAIAAGVLWAEPRRWRVALAGGIPAAVALGLWAGVVWQAGSGGEVGSHASWIGAPGPYALVTMGSHILGGFGSVWGEVVMSGILLGALGVALAAASAPSMRLAIMLGVLPLAIVPLLAALSGRELWVPRYLIVVLPGWWLMLGHAVEAAPARWRTAAVAGLLGWAVFAGVEREAARPRRSDWSRIARALTAGGPRTICAANGYLALPFRFQSVNLGLPLTVLDRGQCTAGRAPDAVVVQPENDRETTEMLEGRGARVGAPRELGTLLPRALIRPITWPAR